MKLAKKNASIKLALKFKYQVGVKMLMIGSKK
jgi:hypothetical protein